MANYVLESRSRSGAYLTTLPFRNLQGEMFLSKPDQFRWDMPLYDPVIARSTFFPGKTELWVYRNGVKIYAGPVWNCTASSKDKSLTCDSQGLESYFDVRRISADATKTSTRGAIAWSLIADSQAMTNGDLGITLGNPGVVPSETVKYAKAEGIYVLDAIDDLAVAGSFDYGITPARVFNVAYPRNTTRARIRLEYGGNVTAYSEQTMGKYAANDILVKGAGTALSQPTIDVAKRAEYGLRQHMGSNSALKTQTDLNAYAQRILDLRRDSRQIPQVSLKTTIASPLDGDINLGEVVPLVINDGWVQYNQDMRLTGFQMYVGKHGEETFVLYLSDLREID